MLELHEIIPFYIFNKLIIIVIVIRDRTFLVKKPDIVILDRWRSRVLLVDVTIPHDVEDTVRGYRKRRNRTMPEVPIWYTRSPTCGMWLLLTIFCTQTG